MKMKTNEIIKQMKEKIDKSKALLQKAKEQYSAKEREFVNLIPEISEEIKKHEKELSKNPDSKVAKESIEILNQISDHILRYAEGRNKTFNLLRVIRLSRKLKKVGNVGQQ
jgi:hypothetical protein